jgi:glucose-1-phosphatase
MFKQLDAIIFDLGGVILNLDYQLTIDAFRNLGKDDFDQLYQQAYQNKVFDQFECGQISSREFRDYLRSFYSDQISDEQIDHAWNVMLLDLPAERIELLMRLKDHFRIFLLSNTNELHYANFREKIRRSFGDPDLLDKIFDKTYYSHQLGLRKPNAEVFQHLLEQNNLQAKYTLFIDDSEQHVKGAKTAGLKTMQLTDNNIVDIFRDY